VITKIFDFRTTCGDRNRSETALSVRVGLSVLPKKQEAWGFDVDVDVDVTPRQVHMCNILTNLEFTI